MEAFLFVLILFSTLWLSESTAIGVLGSLFFLFLGVRLFTILAHSKKRKVKFRRVQRHLDLSECQHRGKGLEEKGELTAWRACQGGAVGTPGVSPPRKSPLRKEPGAARHCRVTCHPWAFPPPRDDRPPKGDRAEGAAPSGTPLVAWCLAARRPPHPQSDPPVRSLAGSSGRLASGGPLFPPGAQPPAPLWEAPAALLGVRTSLQVVSGEAHPPFAGTILVLSFPSSFPPFYSFPPYSTLAAPSSPPLAISLFPQSSLALSPTFPTLFLTFTPSPLTPASWLPPPRPSFSVFPKFLSSPPAALPSLPQVACGPFHLPALCSSLSCPTTLSCSLPLPTPSLALPCLSPLPSVPSGHLQRAWARGIPAPHPCALSLPLIQPSEIRANPSLCRGVLGSRPLPLTPAHLAAVATTSSSTTNPLSIGVDIEPQVQASPVDLNLESGLEKTQDFQEPRRNNIVRRALHWITHRKKTKGQEGPPKGAKRRPAPGMSPRTGEKESESSCSRKGALAAPNALPEPQAGPGGDWGLRKKPRKPHPRKVRFEASSECLIYYPDSAPCELLPDAVVCHDKVKNPEHSGRPFKWGKLCCIGCFPHMN
ncbi:BCL-6 corepressor-like protein 1 [Dasypus novemcinctus]|uniref:BCL-6 corepressor-like protein 1 n=1 Tax=Dasypus novemcinctus TaxID=9361 RepID=UPI00265E1D71|nr:methyl-CpG-binding domain protein 6-like [Dasypus novemcinctus]